MKKSASSSNGGRASTAASKRRTTPSSASRSRRRTPTTVNPGWLRDFVSQMLAVERGGVQLYEKALDDLMHENLRSKLEQFLSQTERHVELCEQLVETAGGEVDDMSPSARAADHKAEGLLTAEVPDEMLDINNLENLVLAETKDHWNWETLAGLTDQIDDSDIKKAAAKAVREVRKQENDHLLWAQKTLTQLALEAAHQAPEENEGENEEAEHADE